MSSLENIRENKMLKALNCKNGITYLIVGHTFSATAAAKCNLTFCKHSEKTFLPFRSFRRLSSELQWIGCYNHCYRFFFLQEGMKTV